MRRAWAPECALDPRTHFGKGFAPLVHVTQLLSRFTSGGLSLADAEGLNADGPLKALLGLEKFPDPVALGEWLRDIGEPGWQALRRINRDFVQWALERAAPARYQHAGRTECFFNDTQIEVRGSTFEGAAMNCEGDLSLSWPVLRTGPFVGDQRRQGKSRQRSGGGKDVSSRRPELLEANAQFWPKESSCLYTDRASSAGKYLEAIQQHFGAWSGLCNKWTGPLEQKAAERPALSWSAAQAVRWREGQPTHCTVWVVSTPARRVRNATREKQPPSRGAVRKDHRERTCVT